MLKNCIPTPGGGIGMSSHIKYTPNPNKILEALVWIASEHPGLGFYHYAKIFFYADKEHLNRFARPIFGDRYIRMSNGPVPSLAYDMLKREPVFDPEMEQLISESLQLKKSKKKWPIVYTGRKPDLSQFSETDRECMKNAMANCHSKPFPQLRRETHREKAYIAANENSEMDYSLMIDEGEHKEEILEELRENAAYLVF